MSRITTSERALGVPESPATDPTPDVEAAPKKPSKPDAAEAPIVETEETP